jgi:hypothetical protein
MITIDDLRAVPMFAGLAAVVLTELVRTALELRRCDMLRRNIAD